MPSNDEHSLQLRQQTTSNLKQTGLPVLYIYKQPKKEPLSQAVTIRNGVRIAIKVWEGGSSVAVQKW